MSSIIKLPLFVFCLLLSFNAISAVDIEIHKGFKGVDSNGRYVCREEVRTGTGWDPYIDFIGFLMNLRYSGNPSSTQLKRSERLERLERIERFKAVTASAASLQASGTSGLAVPLPLMSEVTISPFEPADASTVTLNDQHIPFSDLRNLPGIDRVGPEGCRRLRKDFIAFKEMAFKQIERKEGIGRSDMVEVFIGLYNFFLENLEYADLEDTVITGG